ncbi:hypothetical protein ACEWX3_16185 [Mycobacterium sp. G7A2]|uniref:hypothetical protein n=1 Tax=Mycobacterium sp. G7A2 TaxID=3317307 RepID=UPI0035A83C32
MAEGFDQRYVRTRVQLHGLAEGLIAGPQYRSAGTIRLSVYADGFGGAASPLSIRGMRFDWADGSAPLAGTPRELARAAGVDFGAPEDVYPATGLVDAETTLAVDEAAATLIIRSHHAGSQALRQLFTEQQPVLWPEHFDVAVSVSDVNYGVSAGDGYHPTPYAYVGPWIPRTGSFWNAPFGAAYPLNTNDDCAELIIGIVEFFEQGTAELEEHAP